MIIGVLSNKSAYKELFQKNDFVDVALLFDSLKNNNLNPNEIEILLVDGQIFPNDNLSEIRDAFPTSKVFYKLHQIPSDVITRNIERICSAHKITPINAYYTVEQAVSDVLTVIGKQNGYGTHQIVSFFGTHGGSGVSTTVFSIAKSIAERVNEKVLVLSLNAWDPADYFYQYKGKHLNDIKVDLKTKSLTPSKLGESVYQYKNFYHLAGNRDIKLQRFFKTDEINHLLEVAKEMFDVILIDGGTHFDTAIATQAYVSSSLRFVVTTQDEKGYRGYFPHVFQQLIEPSGGKRSDFMLIINRFQPNMSLIGEKDLELELEMSRVTTIPDVDVLGAVSIHQKNLLYDMADGYYKKNIDLVANLIITEARLKEKAPSFNENTKTKSFFKSLFTKEGVE
ncbi:hypothetical protein [Bacillus alkalicellulosilyticus]|uniref:hypothetical protein n=1 Tax=Alkalihalobacterium alkalicellulosilyticum TaxID=1912214 RepID=UPI000995FC31|nr:hypothetical protein [Bacillus alkalicellulosilyticus]